MTTLPTPSAEAQKHSEQLTALIQQRISEAGGWIDFAQFMQLALYAPHLGYYSAGSQKFGDAKKSGGDFVTAPEISALFAQTIARQMQQTLQQVDGNILELGAGTGKFAADILLSLASLNSLPDHYFILEISNHLRQVQLETLQSKLPPDLIQRVAWLEALPTSFNGLVVANEVLDAIPVHIAHIQKQAVYERGVAWCDGFIWQDQAITDKDLVAAIDKQQLAADYLTEFCPAASGLIASIAGMLQHGVVLLIDYGFSAREYYHPQRNQGTLMCHYQHYAHTEPLINVGLQDITAHVDFTSIADAGIQHGLTLGGFCSQAQFLINCGILDLMSLVSPQDVANYLPLAAAAQKLLSPAEMGDLFKVIAFTKNIAEPLLGFSNGDKSYTL